MKKNILLIFFFSPVISGLSYAQTCQLTWYQNIYWNKNIPLARTKNKFFTPSGNMFVAGFTQSGINSSVDAWLMKTTARGTPLWSKAIGTSAEEAMNGVRQTMDGGFIFVGSTRSASLYNEGWIAKTDSNGIPQWSVSLGVQYSSLSQVTQLADGSYAAVGTLFLDFDGDKEGNITEVRKSTNIIIKIDENGNMLWFSSFHHASLEALNTVIQLSDGSLLVTGNVTNNLDAYLIKINQLNGAMIWMNGYENTPEFKFARCVEMEDRTIHLYTASMIYYFSADGKSIGGRHMILSSDSTLLDRSEVSDVGSISPGIEVFFTNPFPKPPVLFAVRHDSIVVWAHTYKPNTRNLQRFGNGKIDNNNIYLTGVYKADKLADAGSNEYLSYIIKADKNGKTVCADTFNISFNITSIPAVPNIRYGWQYEGVLKPFPVQMYAENLEPVSMSDCNTQTCCRDTIQQRSDFICKEGSFTLPDGLVVKDTGEYISELSTIAGCDSIIKTHLSSKKGFSFSLGNDTCLINNASITFNLPADSSIQYLWQDGSHNFYYTASFPGEYWVTATSSCNSITDSVKIYDNCTPPVYIPSGFTPNNDGLNDVFRIIDMKKQHLLIFRIYNRFGQLLFFTNDALRGWNGSINNIPQPPGTYVYYIQYLDLQNKPRVQKGAVVLIR